MSRVAVARPCLALLLVAGTATGACGSTEDPGNQPAGCPGTPIRVPTPNTIASASFLGRCEGATAIVTWKNGAPGSACTDARQCQPTCCYCSAGGQSALTSWCNHGRCAAANDVCCAVAGTPLASCG